VSAPSTIVILAGGSGTRWGNYQGVQKHFLEVDGSTIIGRTVFLAKTYTEGASIVLVVSDTHQPWPLRCYKIEPQQVLGTDHDKLIGSRQVWSPWNRTVIIWGDIWLSEAGAKQIFTDDSDDILWFGRLGKSYITGKNYGEPFAVSFEASAIEDFVAAIRLAARQFKRGEITDAHTWGVYYNLHPAARLPDGTHGGAKTWREIDDWTEDFDYPHDWDLWVKRYQSGKGSPRTAEEMYEIGRALRSKG